MLKLVLRVKSPPRIHILPYGQKSDERAQKEGKIPYHSRESSRIQLKMLHFYSLKALWCLLRFKWFHYCRIVVLTLRHNVEMIIVSERERCIHSGVLWKWERKIFYAKIYANNKNITKRCSVWVLASPLFNANDARGKEKDYLKTQTWWN